jgi:uncharacterized protein (TIGR00251 family)
LRRAARNALELGIRTGTPVYTIKDKKIVDLTKDRPASRNHVQGAHQGEVMPPRVIHVKVKPNSRQSLLEQKEDGTWLAQIKSPPVDGKANEELITLVARHFKCRKSEVTIKSGSTGRLKLVQIH